VEVVLKMEITRLMLIHFLYGLAFYVLWDCANIWQSISFWQRDIKHRSIEENNGNQTPFKVFFYWKA
jgi:hypothetical protein